MANQGCRVADQTPRTVDELRELVGAQRWTVPHSAGDESFLTPTGVASFFENREQGAAFPGTGVSIRAFWGSSSGLRDELMLTTRL